MPYGYYYRMFDPTYILVLIGVIISLWASAKVKTTYAKYSRVRSMSGMTGAQAAERILYSAGIYDVRIEHVRGDLTDHYDPRNRVLRLSDTVYGSTSVAAIGVAAHECGHAVQHAVGYAPLKLRSALVPVTSFSSRFAIFFIIGGILLAGATNSLVLFWIGIAMIAVSALFSLVTLPVEYDASRRALAWLDGQHILTSQQHNQAKEALTWAARTYVVAALSAIATLLYYIGFARRN